MHDEIGTALEGLDAALNHAQRLTPEQMREVIARLREELCSVRALLKAIAECEGDRALAHTVEVWRGEAATQSARAEALGTRMVLAERALHLLVRGRPAGAEVESWVRVAARQERQEASA